MRIIVEGQAFSTSDSLLFIMIHYDISPCIVWVFFEPVALESVISIILYVSVSLWHFPLFVLISSSPHIPISAA